MLVLTRKKDESIIIGDGIEIIVTGIENGVVKLGIKADKNTKIYRKEVLEQIESENRESISTLHNINVIKSISNKK